MLKAISLFILVNSFAFAKVNFFANDSILIDGYDPVSYIEANKALKGAKDIKIEYQGIQVYFSSNLNKMLFLKDPSKYLPAYGGWCAYALSKNQGLVEVDPRSFKVINGKTYLFYNSWFVDTLVKWNEIQNDSLQIKLANKVWEILK